MLAEARTLVSYCNYIVSWIKISEQSSHTRNDPTYVYLQKDKVYRAVIAANQAQEDGYKYHLAGGAVGTVSPSKLCLCIILSPDYIRLKIYAN